ncbi:MAG: MFS transporter [Bacteroidetes bacterium]|nr:MFS transporter [Bacteroidota bacterium]
MNYKKIITRTILLVSFVSFFNDIASEMLYPIMPVYLKSIGFSFVMIGILEGLAELTAGLSKGYFGNLSDKRGKRLPFVQIGYMLSAVSKPMMAIFTFPFWIFSARTLDKLGKGVRTSARDAMLSDETTAEHKGKVFGFHRAFDTLGASIGPFIALVFLYFYPEQYKWMFFIAFAPGLCSILLTFFIKEKKKEQVNNGNKVKVSFFDYLKYWYKAPKIYKQIIIGLLAFTFFNSSDAFLLLALKSNGMSDTMMIGVYIFYNLVYALAALPVGILADKIGLRKTMIIGFILFAAVYLSMGFAAALWQFGLIFFFYGLYAAATEGISKALISNISAKEETATAIGFYTSFASIFAFLASSIGGFLFFHSPKIMFLFSGTGVVLVVIYFLMLKFKKVKSL